MKKMSKLLVLLKRKDGVTMIELIVALVILSIFLASATALLIPMLNTYTATRELANATILADNIAQVISEDLSYAKSVTGSTDGFVITSSDGHVNTWTLGASDSGDSTELLVNAKPYFDKKYYNGNTLSELEIIDAAEGVYTLSFKVRGKANVDKSIVVNSMG